MKKKIYIVSYVNFDGYDDNLYSDIQTFTDKELAKSVFEQECSSALADAHAEDTCENEEEWYSVDEERYDTSYKVGRSHSSYYTEVKLLEHEIEI